MSWQKERGGGGFELREPPIYGRVWPCSTAPNSEWRAVRRPEPYNETTPGWVSAPTTFKDKAAACAWVEFYVRLATEDDGR